MTKLTELPVWMLLGPASQDALLLGRGDTLPAAIAIARDLGGDAVANVPLMATTRLMLERAHALGGLALTATGALSRADDGGANDYVVRPAPRCRDVCPYKQVRALDRWRRKA
ncbi:hypothetical protein OKC48_24800 [Methylorubrum extorquens]|uniref:hypothetical protein n=1 Tax=Methylorubrum extorquens TaxID=408 RepID=UPI0022380DEF|nr:hypothetical protein [Methylorubrum extorquens]UYW26436.1 hypothetical protein OKC48_24800 [Methylorubrum extorquens]